MDELDNKGYQAVVCRPTAKIYAERETFDYNAYIKTVRNRANAGISNKTVAGFYTNNKDTVTCEMCLKKMSPSYYIIKELRHKVEIGKAYVSKRIKETESKKKELVLLEEELIKATQKPTDIKESE
jgi:hypothetical protein